MVGRTSQKSYSRSTQSRRDYVDDMRRNSRAPPPRRSAYSAPSKPSKKDDLSANFVDLGLAGYNTSTTGSIALLNTVATGVGQSARIGKKIRMKSLQCHGLLASGSATVLLQASYVIVLDKRPQAALPAITDIFTSISPNAFLNDTNSERFRILKRFDHTHVGSTTTLSNDSVAVEVDWYYRFKEKDSLVVYNALGTGAIADIDSGALYLVTLGGNVAGTTAGLFSAAFRLRYYDVAG